MKNPSPLYTIGLTLLIIYLACYALANLVNSDTPYRESMDLVGPYNAYQRKWMHEAWLLSNDKEFMYMLKAENGLLNHDRQSDAYSNGIRENSWGFCQIHFPSHPDIASDPRFFSDPLWQLEKCYELWRVRQSAFHAYTRMNNDPKTRALVTSQFIFF